MKHKRLLTDITDMIYLKLIKALLSIGGDSMPFLSEAEALFWDNANGNAKLAKNRTKTTGKAGCPIMKPEEVLQKLEEIGIKMDRQTLNNYVRWGLVTQPAQRSGGKGVRADYPQKSVNEAAAAAKLIREERWTKERAKEARRRAREFAEFYEKEEVEERDEIEGNSDDKGLEYLMEQAVIHKGWDDKRLEYLMEQAAFHKFDDRFIEYLMEQATLHEDKIKWIATEGMCWYRLVLNALKDRDFDELKGRTGLDKNQIMAKLDTFYRNIYEAEIKIKETTRGLKRIISQGSINRQED